jgi:hypothetical protein
MLPGAEESMRAKIAMVVVLVSVTSAARAVDEKTETQRYICTGMRHDYNADGARIGGENITESLTMTFPAGFGLGDGLVKGPIDGRVDGNQFHPDATYWEAPYSADATTNCHFGKNTLDVTCDCKREAGGGCPMCGFGSLGRDVNKGVLLVEFWNTNCYEANNRSDKFHASLPFDEDLAGRVKSGVKIAPGLSHFYIATCQQHHEPR